MGTPDHVGGIRKPFEKILLIKGGRFRSRRGGQLVLKKDAER